MTHPSNLDLESFACGEGSRLPAVAAHLEECSACATFVERLRGLAAAGPTAAEAEALVARARARTDAPAPAPSAPAPSARAHARNSRRRMWLVTSSVLTPLAAAAAILLLARTSTFPSSPSAASSASPGLAASPARGEANDTQEPDTTFKGGMQIAVVRERGGEQARFASAVRVRPGDRLRVEVALDREQAILGAVLADDGRYLELMPEAVRGPGTHFSERSAKIDAAPTSGTIIIGTPAAVARARSTKQLEGLVTLRVEWEGKP